MKTYIATLGIIAAMIGFASCKKSVEPTPPVQKEKMSITARIDKPAGTRAELAHDTEGILKTTWDEEDEIVVYNPTTKDMAYFTISQLSDDHSSATFTGEIDPTGGTFTAVYGMGVHEETDNDGDFVDWYGRSNDLGYFYSQTGNDNTDHLFNFVKLFGTFTSSDSYVQFSHTLAFFKFVLTLPEGAVIDPESSYDIAMDVYSNRYPTFDLSTGVWDPESGFPTTLMVGVRSVEEVLGSTDKPIIAYMGVFPSDASNRDINLTLGVGSSNISSNYAVTLPAKTSRPIEAGHYYTVTQQLSLVQNYDGDVDPLVPEEF
jgi:hypothetical protein